MAGKKSISQSVVATRLGVHRNTVGAMLRDGRLERGGLKTVSVASLLGAEDEMFGVLRCRSCSKETSRVSALSAGSARCSCGGDLFPTKDRTKPLKLARQLPRLYAD
jgi:hypothetical protein